MKCQQCRWDITEGTEVFESPDGAVFDTAECANEYESKLGANMLAHSIAYLMGEYHGAAGKGDNAKALCIYEAMRIIDRNFYLCDHLGRNRAAGTV